MEPPIPATDRKLITRKKRGELFGTPSFVIGSAIALLWLACAAAPGLFTTRTEYDAVRDSEGTAISRAGPQADAWFGTDAVGRDVFALVVHGADKTVITALLAALVAVLVGAVIGLTMTASRGWTDEALSRVLEAVVSLPVVLLALMVVVIYGSSRLVLVLTIASLFAPLVASTVRSAVLAEAQRSDATSASQRGEPARRSLWLEIVPNISKIVLVEFTVRVRYAVFTVATLSFLGFSVGNARQADWGRDFAGAYSLIQAGQWWPALFPALAITSLAFATNLIGNAIDKVYQT